MVSQIGGGNGGGGGETSEEEEKKEHASLHSLTRRRRSSQPKIPPPSFLQCKQKTAADEVLQNPGEERGRERGVSEAIPIPFLLLALAAAATR